MGGIVKSVWKLEETRKGFRKFLSLKKLRLKLWIKENSWGKMLTLLRGLTIGLKYLVT